MARNTKTHKEVSRTDRQVKCAYCGTYTSVNALTTIMEASPSGKRTFKKLCNKCGGK